MVKKSIIRPAGASDKPPGKLAIKRATMATITREGGGRALARGRHSARRGARVSSC
jgi:hypothetical protein